MFYKIGDGVKEVTFDAICRENLTVGMITLAELDTFMPLFGFSEATKKACLSTNLHIQNSLSVYDEYSFGIINIIDNHHSVHERDKIAFYIRKNLFLIVDIYDADNSTTNALKTVLERATKNQLTLEKIIYYFLNHLIDDDNITLEGLELRIEELEKKALTGEMKTISDDISQVRKELLILHNYYEHLVNIGNDLMENENAIFEEESLRYFKLFTDRVERLSDNTHLLREFVTQVRDAYISQINLNLNNIMKVLTIINIIFLPLTLIVGWYGMNFKYMPELNMKYGYLGVFVLCICVVIGCILWFKKKRFF